MLVAEAHAPEPAVVEALADASTYPHDPPTVEHVQTHISHVFLAGPYVYKLKKPVRFAFLDFGTREARRDACIAEVTLNARLAAPIYLDVVPIVRRAGGGVALDGPGEVVDHVVRSRRLPADRTLAALVARREANERMIDAVAAHVARFHARAPRAAQPERHASVEVLRARWDAELGELAPFVGTLTEPVDVAVLEDFGASFLVRHAAALDARLRGGHVRDVHGDLRAEHVYVLTEPLVALWDAPRVEPGIWVIDCVEFSRDLRILDVVSEVAFLAMDLDHLGRPDLARRFVAAYAAAAGDPAVASFVPFHAAARAVIRAKVDALTSVGADVAPAERATAAARAQQRLRQAGGYAWADGGPAVVVVTGRSGTGKSTVAEALAQATGWPVVATDRLRRAWGVAPGGAAYGAGAYTPAARAAVYDALAREVDAVLGAGRGVVADGTFLTRAQRAGVAHVARTWNAPLVYVACDAAPGVVAARLAARPPDAPSDARWETFVAQESAVEPFEADEAVIRVDTALPLARLGAMLVPRLWRWRRGHGVHS